MGSYCTATAVSGLKARLNSQTPLSIYYYRWSRSAYRSWAPGLRTGL